MNLALGRILSIFFSPGNSHCKRWRYCFCFTTLIPLCFVLTLLELVCLLSCVPFHVSRVEVTEYRYSYYVGGSNNNMKKVSTTNRKILWYKIRLLRFSIEMHKPEGIDVCLISLLISLLFPHLVLPPVPTQTFWPAWGSAQLSPQK